MLDDELRSNRCLSAIDRIESSTDELFVAQFAWLCPKFTWHFVKRFDADPGQLDQALIEAWVESESRARSERGKPNAVLMPLTIVLNHKRAAALFRKGLAKIDLPYRASS